MGGWQNRRSPSASSGVPYIAFKRRGVVLCYAAIAQEVVMTKRQNRVRAAISLAAMLGLVATFGITARREGHSHMQGRVQRACSMSSATIIGNYSTAAYRQAAQVWRSPQAAHGIVSQMARALNASTRTLGGGGPNKEAG
jgi:hypothetical protein